MVRELIYPKKNKAAIVFSILAALALATAVYIFYDIYSTQNKIDYTFSSVYSDTSYSCTKGELAPAPGVCLSEQVPDYDNYYQTPLGFPIISFSDKWTGEKLEDIYDELIKNKHGDEMKLLSGVILYPGKSKTDKDIAVAGTHVTHFAQFPVFFYLPGLVPESMKYALTSQQSVIELYNMDGYKTVAEVAKTLSHEYGHHFTIHYFLSSDDAARESEYYRLRNIDAYGREVFFDDVDDYYENHMWSIYEMAAEDYVQLMGSPNAKQTRQFFDVFDVLYYNSKNPKATTAVYNVFPQENIHMPLADEVPGLRSYFYSFIGEESNADVFPPADFNIRREKKTNHGRTYYDITWDKTTRDKNSLYTLVCYNENGQVFQVVRTVRGNEEPRARVGTAAIEKATETGTSYQFLELQDTLTGETITDKERYFKLYVLWPDGRMQSSKLYKLNFD